MSFETVFMVIFGLLAAGAVLFMVGIFLHWLYRIIFFEYSYGELKKTTGKVTDMKYTPPRTTVSRHATTRSPEKNEVFFVTEQASTSVDSDKLYQRVRVGEEIKVQYQERYAKPRFWHGYWKLDGYRLVRITSKLKEQVDFNEEKPVRRYR